METIINISEGYKAVLLPKDAENPAVFYDEIDGITYLTYFKPEWTGLPLGKFNDRPELIGTLDTLTEETIRKIISEDFKVYKKWLLAGDVSAKDFLVDFIEGLGIQTENPLKEPKYDYPPAIREWEASERKTKRVIIIKCKEE